MSILNQLRISQKLWMIIIISIVLLITTMAIQTFQMRDVMLEEKFVKTRHLVETVESLVEHYHDRVTSGQMNTEQAKQSVFEAIQALRFEKQEYFWINDLTPRMIMHPFKPELNGKSLADVKDPNGKQLFVEMAQVAKRDGAGFVEYAWPKPGFNQPVDKISYVKQFEPWGWVIGSGIYLDDVDALFRHQVIEVSLFGLIIAGILIAVSMLLSRSITRPLKKAVAALKDIASGDGDLTSRLDATGKDEVSQLAEQFNCFVEKLQRILLEVETITQGLTSASEEVSQISSETSQAVARQQSETDQVATAITEMSMTAQDVAKSAANAATAANEANGKSNEGHQIVKLNGKAIEELNSAVQNASEIIARVGKDSESIGAILTTIREIADQTNLLALNAAIEAARAGEQGRGFAVVADEVRSLAQRTQQSTGEIEAMIATLQEGSRHAESAMQTGATKAGESVDRAREAGAALATIANAISTINDMNTQIASAAEEQTSVVEDINRNVVSISDIASETANAAQQTEIAVHSIAENIVTLNGLLRNFRLR